jgi:gluconokinase
MDHVLGIDIGTGSTKAVAVDLGGKPFADHQEMYPYSSPKPGYHEQDPEQIWAAFQKTIKGISHKTGKPLAIGLSSALHSFIPVDENCRALAPMMTWADSRAYAIAKKLRASDEGMAIYRATGTPLHAMSPLCKLIWLRENDTKLFNAAYKFISIKEYIWYRLFNEFKVDHSIASGTGLFNVSSLSWHTDSLQLAGITENKLSEPVATNYTQKYLRRGNQSFLEPGTPVTISASDGCLANLGSMADKPGIAAITIGTSGAVRVASNKPLPNDKAMTFSYILDAETFICGGPINNGGIAMQWWLKNFAGAALTGSEYDKAFEQIALVAPGCDGLIFLPYLTGERAPIWDSESCGTFFGVKLQHTRQHFSRAVLEGICFALKDVLEAVQENSALITQINISGGFVKSDTWVQTLADITGKKLAIVQPEDASAVGAALMAMKETALIKEYPTTAQGQKVFEPNDAHAAIYEKNFKIYRQLYADLKTTMHKVSNIED